MFYLFGWPTLKSGEQSLSTFCSRCQRNTTHRTFTQRTWFTFFFIPIIPLSGKSPHAICNVCGQDAHQRGSAAAALPSVARRATPQSAGGAAGRLTKQCPQCAEDVLLEATICRFCGRTFSAQEVAGALHEHQQAQVQAANAAQRAAWAWQQEQQRRRLRGRIVRRWVFGVILAGFGGFMLLLALAMFFTPPAPHNTAKGQKDAAMGLGFFGLVPLAIGGGLIWAARTLEREAQATSAPNPMPLQTYSPGRVPPLPPQTNGPPQASSPNSVLSSPVGEGEMAQPSAPESSRIAEGSNEMFCTHCGAIIGQGAAFCTKCGVPVGAGFGAVTSGLRGY